ncbi:MAG: tyrosine-type recombinase/integrase [Nitrosopumilus sp.]|nr:tyrosine-type recombinase/integrase [Nitrosopumilus sp.]NRA05687.1 tyrosine-type recombinase/integrase [Nitrosopumilus sp.]
MTQKILSDFSKIDHTFSVQELLNKNKEKIQHTCSADIFYRYHTVAIKAGVDAKILSKKLHYKDMENELTKLQSIQFWQSQLRDSKYKNIKENFVAKKTTKYYYLTMLTKFNKWLVGQTFKIKKQIQISEDTFRNTEQTMSFSNIEETLELLECSSSVKKDIIRIIRQYLNDPIHEGSSVSYMNSKFSAISSYYSKNENPLDMKYDPKNKYDVQELQKETGLTLDEFMCILTVGRPSLMEKAIFMCKFHGGYDSSTFADRFNFDGFRQISKYFGTTDYNAWDLDKYPIPITQVRIKTGFQYTTLLERDAIHSIQQYLDYKIKRHGKHQVDEPLFLNHYGRPITTPWISHRFSTLAERAGVQKKISKKQNKIEAHEVRDLLKSTLIDSGCRMDVADHVIGHKPKDSYEKQAKLYHPETLRKEYSKASKRLNIFTKFTSVVNGTDDADELRAELNQKMQELDNTLKQERAEFVTRTRNNILVESQKKTLDKILENSEEQSKTINYLKEEIKKLKSGEKSLEFCCVDCSTIHSEESCRACHSKLKRIYEGKVQN